MLCEVLGHFRSFSIGERRRGQASLCKHLCGERRNEKFLHIGAHCVLQLDLKESGKDKYCFPCEMSIGILQSGIG